MNTALVAYQAAERKAANAIENLIGGHTWHTGNPNAKHQDAYAYGFSSIPDNVKTPWGGKVSKKDGCLKSTLKGTVHFFEGAGESLWGMVTGLGDLVGLGGWDKFKASWQGMQTLTEVLTPPGMVFGILRHGPVGYLKEVIAFDKGWDCPEFS